MPQVKDKLCVRAAELQPSWLVRATEQPRSWTEEKPSLTEGHPRGAGAELNDLIYGEVERPRCAVPTVGGVDCCGDAWLAAGRDPLLLQVDISSTCR